MHPDHLYAEVQDISKEAHAGQKYGDKDYFSAHIESVSDKVAFLYEDDDDYEIIDNLSYLHDVREDSHFTEYDIRARLKGYDRLDELMEALDAITKRPGESRDDYLKRCCANSIAWKVKVADTMSNLECSVISNEKRRIIKYTTQIQKLYSFTDQNAA
ncbi:hypothetical protein REH81_06340 [Vibrio rotiferianus]